MTQCCRTLALGLIVVAAGSLALEAQAPAAPREAVPVPAIDWGFEMLEVLAYAQEQAKERFDVDNDFRFTDRRSASGITFINTCTVDSAKYYQPNHYDHGNGLAVADVDGDQRYDIYFLTQYGSNELWRNLGGGRFENITARAGVALADRDSVAGSFGDVDNDGDPDLFVTSVRAGNVLFINDGQGNFADATAASGVAYSGHSSGAVFLDFDLDGWLDLFVTNVGVYTENRKIDGGHWLGIGQEGEANAFDGHLFPERTEYSILYRNLGGGRFEDVSEKTGLREPGWNGDATFVDFDGDLYPDIYVTNMQGDDHYWVNEGGKHFAERTAEFFPKTPWGTMGIKFFDHNHDGLMDLVLTDMHSDMSREIVPGSLEKLKSLMQWPEETLQGTDNNIFGNGFYEQQADGTWRERSDELGVENYWPWGVSVDDINADGYDDVLITSSMNFPYRYGINTMLLNNRGRGFLDSEFLLGIEPRSDLPNRSWYDPQRPWLSTKKPWFNLACGGADRAHPLCAGRSGDVVALGNLGTRSAAIFDLDDDGDLDIVTGEFNDRPQVLVSDLADRRAIRFVKIRLVGSGSNRDGLGAKVTVEAGGVRLVKYHDGKSGYLSQSSLPLYFGLAEAPSIDRIIVAWPSGKVQEVTDRLTLNSVIEITEP
jgi:hypothetical protein